MIVIDDIISALISVPLNEVKSKIERNERVIKFLKDFKLDPDHPRAELALFQVK